MGVITIGEFSSDAARAVARVEAGETLQITRDGRPVAVLRPPLVAPIRDAQWHQARAELDSLMAKGFGPSTGKVTYDDKYGDAPL